MKLKMRLLGIVVSIASISCAGPLQPTMLPTATETPLVVLVTPTLIPATPTPFSLPTPTPLPKPTPTQVAKGIESSYIPPLNSDWISPGKVSIGNFYPGATAEYPITIHNGSDGLVAETLKITTEALETTADIPIKNRLAFPGKFTNVKLTSDLADETLLVTSYQFHAKTNSPALTITGFIPNATRRLTIEYIKPTVFRVYFRVPTRTSESFVAATEEQKDWVLIADDSPVFLPLETRDILITLQIPKAEVVTSKKWEFWVVVAPASTGMVKTELASKWLVTMR